MTRNRIWFLSAVALYALCFAVNLAGAWWEYNSAAIWNFLVSVAYILFWILFTADTGTSRGRRRVANVVAVLTLIGGLLGLVARAPNAWFALIPALALTPLTAMPMYGLRMLFSWNMTYMLTGLLGGLWMIWLTWKKP